jgi:glycosyltransferase involved in cell wall biosynthesis
LRVIARLNIGGPAIHTILLTRHMEPLGYETHLVAGQVGPEEGNMDYLAEAQGVKPMVIPQLGRNLHAADDVVALFRILRLLFRVQPRIVDTHTAKAGALGRIAAWIYNAVQGARRKAQGSSFSAAQGRCKVVHTFHGHILRGYFSPVKTKLFRWIERFLARKTDAIVVVSEKQRDELCGELGIGRPDQYRVIALGFELEPFGRCPRRRGEFREQIGYAGSDAKLVGIIGRLTPIKNHRLFLEAARRLTGAGQDRRPRFVIVGDGELRGELERIVHEFGLAERVTFTGWVRDLEPIYADLDVLALTSDNEGTPVAVIEALAAGLPIVATDVGGVRELLSRRRSPATRTAEGEFEVCERGVLARRDDAAGFANAIKFLLDNPAQGRAIGLIGREYAMKHHSLDRLVADMDRLYRSLLREEQAI